MKKLVLTAIVTGASLLAVAAPKAYEGGLKPLLKEVKVDGQVLYSDDMTKEKAIDIKGDKPVKVEYTFVNKGDKPSVGAGRVFVHFMKGNKIAMGGDFTPKVSTSKWTKDFVFKQTRTYNFKKLKGAKIRMMVGIYFFKEKRSPRIKLLNKNITSGARVPVGYINVQ